MSELNADEIKMDTQPSIGDRLRQAREAKKLSVSDVAAELRLTKHTIEHIENEHWAELHGRAYSRGYFTSYVRLLGLPEDELLAAFNVEYASVEPAPIKLSDTNKQSSWLPSLLLIIVLVGSWFAYQQWQISQQQSSQDIAVVEDNESTDLADTMEQPVLPEEVINERPDVLPESQQDINEIEQAVVNKTTLLTNNEAVDVVDEKSEIIEEKLKITAAPEVAKVIVSSVDDTDSIEVATLEGVLDLQFSGECWVEVRDANGHSLLNKGMGKGDAIVLMGKTPLNVVFGRASTARVKFNNEVFNFEPFTLSSGVARFTLGAES